MLIFAISFSMSASGNTVEIIVASTDHTHFKNPTRKCRYYWPYYAGKIVTAENKAIRQTECPRYADEINLSKGYAPLGVFFRSRVKRPASDILTYDWEIKNKTNNKILARFDSFNAANVFEKAGEYEVSLRVNYKDGTKDTDTTQVSVWPRDKKNYYVDALAGDDRFNGLSKQPDRHCEPGNSPIGACNGPWRTATRAFSELAPHDWHKKAAKNYTAASTCKQLESKTMTRYPNGDFSLYRGSTTPYPQALKDKNGRFIKPYVVNICKERTIARKSILGAGDQILFKRGQQFELQTGLATLSRTQQKQNGKVFNYEKLNCTSLLSPRHWQYQPGVLFSAYGEGANPLIQNTGTTSCMLFNLTGVGLMHLAFQDLVFDLESTAKTSQPKRASFMFSVGHALNLVFNRLSLKKFNQGIQFHNAHGVFINNSYFNDSGVVHLYSETATDVAFINNKFDYSGNHIAYTNMSNALVVGNTFSRQAFGRTALRVSGTDLKHPTHSIWVSDNSFKGWIDPRTRANCKTGRCQFASGKRYNFSLVEFHPNTPAKDRFSERIVFTRNTLKDAENLLRVGGVRDLLVENNIFSTRDKSDTALIKLHSGESRRALKKITIKNNKFIAKAKKATGKHPVIELSKYANNLNNHKLISITDNDFQKTTNNCKIGVINYSTRITHCILPQVTNTDNKTAPPNILDINDNI